MRLVLATVLAAVALADARAVTVRTWGPASAEGFSRGTLEGTAIDAEGWLSLARTSAPWWGPGAGIVWDVAPDGERGAFLALSGPARVLHVVSGKPAETWFEEDGDAMVTALVPDGRGGVLFAVSPGGRILRARGAGQAVEPVRTAEARYVWALAVEGDRLWVGTGEPGTLLRRVGAGAFETVTTTGEDPVRALAPLPGGGVVVGTGRRGRVLRVSPDGTVFALLDADEDEIVDLAAGDGALWALAARDRGRARSRAASDEGTRTPGDPPAEGRTTVPDPDPPDEGAPPPAPSPAPDEPRAPAARTSVRAAGSASASSSTGALYRLGTDGGVTRVWETSTETPYAVAFVAGTPVVATGESGRLLRIDRDGAAASLARFPSDQVTALAVSPAGRLLVGGSNDARLAALGPETAASGSWLSEVFDAGTASDWGAIRWDGRAPAGAVSLSVRAGNTAEPDATWSAWQPVRAVAGGNGVPSSLPVARFVQAKIELAGGSGADPRLRRLEVAYRPRNRAPRIRRFDVEAPGVAIVSQPAPTSPGSGPVVADDPVAERTARAGGRRPPASTRRLYEAGARSATWDAADPDDDTLRYRLELREVGEESWRLLAEHVETGFFSWDSRGTPDGLYELRLTADDGEDNPAGTERTDLRLSDPFLVDHTAPRLEGMKKSADGRRLRFAAVDPGGRIAAVEAAEGAGPWRRLSPEDGIEDGDRESYGVDLPASGALRLRVTDAAGNLGGAETAAR
jgi:hypothetical protein